ncbi:unnamed protein product, partial [Rotaria magnacalcarata]
MRKDDYSQEDIILEFALANHDDSSKDEIERYAKAKLVTTARSSVTEFHFFTWRPL